MDGPTVLPIDRPSTAHRAADAIRAELLSGRIALGTPMRDTDWSGRLGVSRPTTREAFAELVRDGLLVHSLHRGVEVARLDVAALADIYAVRRLLEVAALSAARSHTQTLAAMGAALDAMAAASRSGDTAAEVAADAEFHLALVAALGSDRLSSTAARSLSELRLVLSVLDREEGVDPQQLGGHRELLAAIRGGSQAAAKRALLGHLDDAERRLIPLLVARG